MKYIKNSIIFQNVEVDNMLNAMGLDKAGLMEAITYAASERALCTANDPVGFPNFLVYAKTARRLRELYCIGNRGWIKDDTSNQAAIKHPSKKLRLVPCNFDEFAGNKLITPSNKSPKGEISRKKSLCNRTAWLPGLPDVATEGDDGYQTWILGMHVNEEGIAGAELSLPIDFNDSHFTDFAHRIILSSGENNPQGNKRSEIVAATDDTIKVVDIAVKRK